MRLVIHWIFFVFTSLLCILLGVPVYIYGFWVFFNTAWMIHSLLFKYDYSQMTSKENKDAD